MNQKKGNEGEPKKNIQGRNFVSYYGISPGNK